MWDKIKHLFYHAYFVSALSCDLKETIHFPVVVIIHKKEEDTRIAQSYIYIYIYMLKKIEGCCSVTRHQKDCMHRVLEEYIMNLRFEVNILFKGDSVFFSKYFISSG